MVPFRLFRSRLVAGLFLGLTLAPTALLGAPAEDRSTSPPNTLGDTALVQALRQGGHVVYFRHGKTDLTTQDTDRTNLANCATQRKLSQQGRQEMAEIGKVFVQLGIPVATVRSSPYCRALDTARLAFGRVTPDADLTHTVTADETTSRRQAQALRRLLATVPEAGRNAVLAGHTGNLQEATGIWPSPEGVAIVFKPDGQGGFAYVATVRPEQWAELLRGEKAAAPRAARP